MKNELKDNSHYWKGRWAILNESNKVLKKENIFLNKLVNRLTSNKTLTPKENALLLSDIAIVKGEPFE